MPKFAVIDHHRAPQTARRLAAFTAGIALCCWWSIDYTRGPLGLSTLWVSSGVLCGVLLTSPRRQWPGYVLASFVASLLVNFIHNGVGFLGVVSSFANTLDAYLVAWVVSRRVGDVSSLAQIKRSVLVATSATIAACSVSGLTMEKRSPSRSNATSRAGTATFSPRMCRTSPTTARSAVSMR